LGCFLLMNTIDYRFVHLAFVIPQIVAWLHVKEKDISLVSKITLAAMVFSLWNPAFALRLFGRNTNRKRPFQLVLQPLKALPHRKQARPYQKENGAKQTR